MKNRINEDNRISFEWISYIMQNSLSFMNLAIRTQSYVPKFSSGRNWPI